jgi:hypothetical protein
MNWTPNEMSFSLANEAERDEQNLWHVCVRGEVHSGICWGDIRRDNLENLGLDTCIQVDGQEIEWQCMDRIYRAKEYEKWRAVMSTAMNIRVPDNAGNILAGWGTIPSFFFKKKVLCSINLFHNF